MPKIKEYPEASLADRNDALILDTEEGTKYIRASNLLASSSSTVDRTTASGSVVHFEDGADGIPMKDVIVSIKPAQEGSGDPSPDNVRPITGWTGAIVTKRGKNFLENTADSKVSAGITFRINSDKTVTVSGTATSSTNLNLMVGFKIPKGEYILSGCPNGGSSSTYEILAVYNGATYRDYGNGVLLKVVDDNPIQYVQVVVRNGYTANNLIFEPMIRYSDGDPTYEPYSGQTYNITFPAEAGTVYGGTLDVTKGELVVDRAIWIGNTADMDNGENFPGWQKAEIVNIVGRGINAGVPSLISNVSPAIASGRYAIGINTVGSPNSGVLWLNKGYFNKNQTEWKALALDIQIILPLANPITYTLTSTGIKSLLGDNNVWADCGDTEVEYRADTKMYIDRKIAELQALILENEGN